MHISQLFIYPVKSCAGIQVDELTFDESGPVGDRRFVVVNSDGDFITQREISRMARIQPILTVDTLILHLNDSAESSLLKSDVSITLSQRGPLSRVRIWRDETLGHDCGDEVAVWLSEALGVECRLMRLPEHNLRCADDEYAPTKTGVSYADGFPLLVVSQASMDALSARAGTYVDVRRFRPNIVVGGVGRAYSELHWQRLLFEGTSENKEALTMVKPCERCIIPMRDPDTLERSDGVMQALKDQCRINGRMIFGQNAVYNGVILKQGVKVVKLEASVELNLE